MATKFKFEIESDGLTPSQTLAFRTFIGTLGGTEFLEQIRQEELKETSEQETTEAPEPAKKKRASRAKAEEVQAEEVQAEEVQAEEVQAEEVQAEEPQAEEPQAEEPQAEEPQAEEQDKEDQPTPTKTSAYSIQDVRDRVKAKQVKWRTSMKAELKRLGSPGGVSLLDPKHFEEFCNFMDNLA